MLQVKQLMLIGVMLVGLAFGSEGSTGPVKLTTGHWPPYLDSASNEGGFAAQIIREAFATQGLDVDFDYLPWSRALMLANTSAYHGTAIWSCTQSRTRRFKFSEPILPFRYVFYHRASEPFDWQNVQDLEGKMIGLTQDYAYGTDLKKAARKGIVKTDTTTSDEANFRKLVVGRIDLFPMDPVVGSYILKNELPSVVAGQVTYDPTPVREAAYHVLFSRSNPEAADLKDKFDRGLASLKASGRLAQLLPEDFPVPDSKSGRASRDMHKSSCLETRQRLHLPSSTTRFRPEFLASYKSLSQATRRSDASIFPSASATTPTLIVDHIFSPPSNSNGYFSMVSRKLSANLIADLRFVFGINTTNSSPPVRATTSDLRARPFIILARNCSTASPTGC